MWGEPYCKTCDSKLDRSCGDDITIGKCKQCKETDGLRDSVRRLSDKNDQIKSILKDFDSGTAEGWLSSASTLERIRVIVEEV